MPSEISGVLGATFKFKLLYMSANSENLNDDTRINNHCLIVFSQRIQIIDIK